MFPCHQPILMYEWMQLDSGGYRSKKRRSSSVNPGSPSLSGELPEIDLLPRRGSGKCDMIDYFASGDFQAGILAQSRKFCMQII